MTSNMWSWESIEKLRNTPGKVVVGFPKTKEEWETWYPELVSKLELDCLKKLQKAYKGTVWEAPINERIAEVDERLAELKKK